MPEAVIDALEVINIEEYHGHHAVGGGFFGELLRKNLVEPSAIEQAGQGVVMGYLLQRGASLVQLAEQCIDPAQVTFLVLQFLVGQSGADAAADHQQGDDGHRQAQLNGVVIHCQ